MVLLVVKGTKHPDEFVFECPVDTVLDPNPADGSASARPPASASPLPTQLCRIQNTRHQLRLMLFSARELAKTLGERPKPEPPTPKEGDEKDKIDLASYTELLERLTRRLADKASPVTADEFDHLAAELRAQTTALDPARCTHPEGPPAAVQALHAAHEDPDLDEDTRLEVYHYRAILDPDWRAYEQLDPATVGLWFGGKLLRGGLARYTGGNEKSRLTVRLAPAKGPAPSTEPAIPYDAQRAFAQHRERKQQTLQTLAYSELQDQVRRQSRPALVLPPSTTTTTAEEKGGMGMQRLVTDTKRLRPICPRLEERPLDGFV